MTWSLSRSPEVENLDITYALCVSVGPVCRMQSRSIENIFLGTSEFFVRGTEVPLKISPPSDVTLCTVK